MRNYIKKQIADVLRSLFDADRLLNKLVTKGNNIQNEFILLQDMQSAAIEIGNVLEDGQESEEEAVRILEEVCELIWQISQANADKKKKLCKLLHKKLEAVQRETESIPTEFEIVFLPYKVSMWDSFESVWIAAKNDNASTVYVIPIPYFDRKADGNLGEMHYEGGLFPKDVPVTDWQQYDFDKRRPDIIYFHNPYDEFNYVTSVHPFFYSDSLKKYTDKLVYIPYYVCSESTRRENCLQKGIINADSVIVQSEKIKQEFIKYYRKEVDKNIPPDKFLVLGSPKFDKVIHCGEQQNGLVMQWKQRAAGRKIILYNTHLNSFLRHEKEAVRKIETVFQYFMKQDDVILLWRPHPLSRETLKAMRTELYEEYAELERKYVEEKTGIFDDSEDMYSAISAADGYYGDSSSMLSLFGATGKPICIQNVSVTDYGYDRLKLEAVCIDDKRIYFADKDCSVLMEIDKTSGCMRCLDELPEGNSQQKQVTSGTGIWKGKLWMMPFSEGKVCSYDMASGCWDTYGLPEQWAEENRRQPFLAGKQIGRYYYGFGSRKFGVLKLDMETGEISYSADNQYKYEQIATQGGGIICRQDCCLAEGKLYAACLRGNIVLEYDLRTEKIEIYRVGSENNRYITVAYDGSAFWLTTMEGMIIRWKRESGEIKELTVNLRNYHRDWINAFASSLYAEGYIWLFAYSVNMNIRINVFTYEIEKVYEFPEPYRNENKVRVLKSWYEGGKVYFIDAYSYALICMDVRGNTVRRKLTADAGFERLLSRIWMVEDRDNYVSYIHRESHEFGKNLSGFLDFVKSKEPVTDTDQRECFLRFTKYPQGNSGEMIHRKITEKE